MLLERRPGKQQLTKDLRGVMVNGVTILGTWPYKSLEQGQKVYLAYASNQPNDGFYAWPVNAKKSMSNIEDAILIDNIDVSIVKRGQ